MSDSAIVPLVFDTAEEEERQSTLTYRLDPDRKRIVGRVDDLEAVNQAIRKYLITPRFKCLIYDNQYGSELKETIIAGDATPEYVKTETQRIVRDTLSVDDRILEVSDFDIDLSGDSAFIRFHADTIYGEIVIEEVI